MFCHFTHRDNIDDVLGLGLLVGREPSEKGVEWVLAFYDENPIYLTTEGSDFITAYRELVWDDYERLDVDTTGLPLVADLPSLIDIGARYADGLLYVGGSTKLAPLQPFADEYGWIEIEQLLDPRNDAAAAAIKVTSTAACLSSIPPERLTFIQLQNGNGP